MAQFEKVSRVYPEVTVHQRIDLKALSESVLLSEPGLDEQFQETIDLVCADGLLQRVEAERIQMEQEGQAKLTSDNAEDAEDILP